MDTQALHALQLTLEDRMVSRGVERYHQNIEERGLSTAAPGKALRRRALEPTAAAITVAMEKKGRGKRHEGLKFCRGISPYVLADLTMRRALDGAVREEKVLKVTKAIGAAVEWHAKDASLYQAHRALWNKKQEQLKATQNAGFRRRSIDGSVASLRDWARGKEGMEPLVKQLDDVKGLEWTDEQMVDAGVFLLDLFCEASNLVTTEEIRTGARSSKAVVRLTEGTAEWLRAQNEYNSLMRPVYMPMVVPPRDWTAQEDGGYLDNSKARVPFIMTRAKNLETGDLTDAMDAVNLIQSTPLRVNKSVFDVMRQVWNAGSKIGLVPPKFAEDGMKPLPELTPEQQALTTEERKVNEGWRTLMRARRDVYEFNALFRAEIEDFTRLMAAAEEYAPFEAFWLPYKLDWRQRCYPVVSLLSPQGDQFNRGLIEFAHGKRMGDSENSAAWLAIHGANTYGIDKVPFADRIAWVEAHQSEIIASALDPFGCSFWQEADGGAKAWPFLAFCFEWAAYCITGDEHVTHLPVALDGSNSGLQHLSAMVRDTEGAKATNVAPCVNPADIYTEICSRVEDALRVLCATENSYENPWPFIWRKQVVRKICKQPTMTYTYSATLNGMVGQIESALSGLDVKAQAHGKPSYLAFTEPTQTNKEAARFLGPIVLDAIKGRLPKAAAAMDFLVTCARVASSADVPLRWETPLGVPVVQFYPKLTEYQKKLFIDGRRHDVTITRADPSAVDKRSSAYGVSPNFVHSMDSSHLLWTVLACNDEYGITDFSMIHDSFGTHATACDEMADTLRRMFVRLYSEDRLSQFRAALVESLTRLERFDLVEELPPLPETGTFDLETVMESQYFFA